MLFCCLFAIPLPAHAQTAPISNRFTVSSDEPYYIYNDGFYRYIYTKSDRPLLRDLVFFNSKLRALYQKDFNWKFDDPPYLILASNHNQIANGETTILPRLFTVFFPAGAEIPDEFAANSWLYMLLSHETSHMYQLDQKEGYSAFLKKYFGDTSLGWSAFLSLPFTYMEYPNEFLPTFLLEGNAVLNESRFGNGGRLYSGSVRAAVFALAKAGDVNSTRLMNDHLYFPYTNEKYWVGGYLQDWLSDKFGVQKVDHFFYEHSFNYVNPLNVREAFVRTFGFGYEAAIKDFLKHWQPIYSTQKSAASPTLFVSMEEGPLTQENNKIRFLTTDLESEPTVHIYNIKTGKWENRKIDLPMGSIFQDEKGHLVSASAEQIDNANFKAGLFGDGYTLRRGTENQIVYDQQGSCRLYADANKSFLHFSLWSECDRRQQGVKSSTPSDQRTYIGKTVSSAIFGPHMHPYYFGQNEKNHILYRGPTKLFSYKGFWGFPVKVSKNGAVYFVAPVKRGSSLFKWQNGTYTRLTDSDVVVDAQIIDSQHALVAEFSATGYRYKIITLQNIAQSPYDYKYKFESSPNFHLYDLADSTRQSAHPTEVSAANTTANSTASSTSTPAKSTPVQLPKLNLKNERPYSSWRNLHYEGIDPSLDVGWDSINGVLATGGLNMHFSDPLQDQNLAFSVGGGSYNYADSTLSYLNTQYVLNWELSGEYIHGADVVSNSSGKNFVLGHYDAWVGTTGVIYPFFVRPQWSSEISEYFAYEDDQDLLRNFYDANQYVDLTRFVLDRHVVEPLGFDDYRHFSLEFDHELLHDAPQWVNPSNVYAGEASLEYDIWHQTYISAAYQDSWTDGRTPVVELRNFQRPFLLSTAATVYRLTDYADQYYYEVRRTSFELKQAFDYGLYFTTFPLSLRRFAVLGVYNRYDGSFRSHGSPDHLFDETGGGIEFEFLLANKYPFRMTWLEAHSTYSGTNVLFTLGANATF